MVFVFKLVRQFLGVPTNRLPGVWDYTNKLPNNMVSDYTNCISDNVSLRLSNGK